LDSKRRNEGDIADHRRKEGIWKEKREPACTKSLEDCRKEASSYISQGKGR